MKPWWTSMNKMAMEMFNKVLAESQSLEQAVAYVFFMGLEYGAAAQQDITADAVAELMRAGR